MAADGRYDPQFFPGIWAADPSHPPGAPAAKSPPLIEIYPEKDAYLRVAAERYFDLPDAPSH